MDSAGASFEHRASVSRTLALMRAAAASFADQPFMAAEWLHSPHPLLLGASPAAAAWCSTRLARYAALLLAHDIATAQARGEATDLTIPKSGATASRRCLPNWSSAMAASAPGWVSSGNFHRDGCGRS